MRSGEALGAMAGRVDCRLAMPPGSDPAGVTGRATRDALRVGEVFLQPRNVVTVSSRGASKALPSKKV